jgi:hypothetical protein
MIQTLWPVFFGSVPSVAPATAASRAAADAGIFRAGVTHAGMSKLRFQVLIGGVDQTARIRIADPIVIVENLSGEAPTLTFSVFGITPTLGSDVKVLQATPNDYLFGGTIVSRQPTMYGLQTGKLHWHCIATGYVWLMNRFALVTKRYPSRGINTILADLLTTSTNGGFRVGYAPSSLGTTAIDFRLESVEDCINRLVASAATDAYWEVTPERIVNVYDTYPDANLPTVTERGILLDGDQYSYTETNAEIRTRAVAVGAGSTATATAGPLSTTVPLQDVAKFSASGGEAISNYSIFSYTGKSADAGPGDLTGVSGLDYDIVEGDSVDLYAVADDFAKQGNLSVALGSGLSGVAVHLVDNEATSLVETQRRAQTDIAQHGDPNKTLQFTYDQTPRRMAVGRLVAANIATPLVITGDFRVQMIMTTVHQQSHREVDQDIRGPSVKIRRQVSASRTVRTLSQVLRKVA